MDAHVEEQRPRLSRTALVWAAAVALLVALFAAAVLALNLTAFSASGFVTTYLQTLGAGDIAGALDMPGVDLPEAVDADSPDAALLNPTAIGSIRDIRTESDVDAGGGVHRVTMSYTLVSAGRESKSAETQFTVKNTGVMYAVFNQWRFVQSPVATLAVQVEHATSVTVGARLLGPTELGAPSDAFRASHSYDILVPGLFVLEHESYYLESDVATVAAVSPGATEQATVPVYPGDRFRAAVKQKLDGYLDACAAQKKLFPAGCPFGKTINDRIAGDPAWTIVSYPPAAIAAGATSWAISQDVGVAHISVPVESLFDGTVSTLDEDVPFTLDYSLVLAPDDTITFVAH